jgi:regulator of sigma E protease
LTAVISLNLALVNFLPIPALDGGHFMFLLIEKIRRKPLDEDTINKISSVFFLLLIVFMVFIVFNDVYALIKHKF